MHDRHPPPRWLGTAASLVLIVTVLGTGLLLIALLGGAADPKPLGRLVVDDRLDVDSGWTAGGDDHVSTVSVNGAYHITVMSPDRRAFVTAPYRITAPATVELLVRLENSPSVTRYGLWWGEGYDGPHMAAAVNGNGYLSVWSSNGTTIEFLRPWATFPWVLPAGQNNHLRIDLSEDRVLVGLNDEVVDTFSWQAQSSIQMGVVIETTVEGGAEIAVDRLLIWQADSAE